MLGARTVAALARPDIHMPDPRSAMKEFRFLEQKRAALGLTLDEEYRLAELRDLVGPELERAARPGTGFDVNAAAARLRAALLPAGGGSPMAGPSEGDEASEQDADALLDAVLLGGGDAAVGGWEPGVSSAPAEPHLTDLPWETADVPLDPTATYAVPEPRWDLGAYDPGAPVDPGGPYAATEQDRDPFAYAVPVEPLDPAAPYAATEQDRDPFAHAVPVEPLDPGAPLDPNAFYAEPEQGWDPNAYADPGAAPLDPSAPYAAEQDRDPFAHAVLVEPLDPSATCAEPEQGWDPNAYVDPGAAPLDPSASCAEPEQGWDPNAYVDPGAAPLDPNATCAEPEQGWDPNAYVDPGAAPLDPSATCAEPEQGWDPNAYVDPGAAPLDPNATCAEPEQGWDPNAYVDPGAATLDPSATYAEPEQGWDPNAYADPAALVDPGATDAGVPAAAEAEPLLLENDVELLDPSSEPATWPAPERAPVPIHGSLLAGLALEDEGGAEPVASPAPGDASDLPPDGWDVSAPRPVAPLELALGEYDETAGASAMSAGVLLDPTDPDHLAAEPAPAPTPDAPGLALGEYDELAPAPLGGTAGADALELLEDGAAPGAERPAPALGEYDDTSGFEHPAGAFATGAPADLGDAADLPVELAGEAPLDPPFDDAFELRAGVAVDPDAPEARLSEEHELETDGALRLGFQLESGGSFEAATDATVPEWARASEPAAWEDVPADPLHLERAPGELEQPRGEPLDALELDDAVLDVDEAGAVLELDGDATATADLAEPVPPDPAAADLAEPVTPEPAASDLAWTLDSDPFTAGVLPSPAEPASPPPDLEPLRLDELSPEPEADPEPFTAGGPAAPPVEPEAAPFTMCEPAAAGAARDLGGARFLGRSAGLAAPDLDLGRAGDVGPPETAPAPDLAAAPGLEADVDLEDLPTLEGDLLEEIPADELVPLPEEPPGGAPPEPAWGWAATEPEETSRGAAALSGGPASEPEPEPEPARGAAPARASQVAGAHRVVIHTTEGQARRGLLEDADLAADTLQLLPLDGGEPEPIPTSHVKAVFFMLAPDQPAPAPEGKRVHVTFRDGRRVAGFSPDYSDGSAGFFMVPAETRANTGRIWVYQWAVKQVAVG